ncbi:MAG TPA: GPP34 family phosphoprotein [Mycobacterium sp.]|nr:GPP34 family phosphoprotein [Mycobacterium sp.]
MARIAEELLLLLLDNASARPGLERVQRERVLSAAVLLDLAHACRIRPAMDSEPVEAGRLMVLSGADPVDPVAVPTLQLLLRHPLTPAAAIAKLRRKTPTALLTHLERTGQLRRVRTSTRGFNRSYAWPLTDRARVAPARATLLSVLFENQRPDPVTASIISLLYTVDGLGALLSMDNRGRAWARNRAGDIAGCSWISDSEPELSEFNLAVTTAAVRNALQ